MDRKSVESSAIKSIGYYNRLLEVRFTNGTVYQFKNVPKSVYEAFLDAESKGSFFNRVLRGKFEHMTV